MSVEMAKPVEERIRFSRLKLFAKSPAHYLENAPSESAALDKGTAVHSVLLKGARVTYFDRVTDSGRAAPRNGQHWDKFQAENADAIILTRGEYDSTMRMVESVRKNADAMALITGGKVEDTILFDYLGLPSRTTPDTRHPTDVVELKTCRSSEPYSFSWQVKKLHYHAQMAFHVDGMLAVNSTLKPVPYIVAVESAPPFPVTVFRVPPDVLEEGERLIRFWFEQLRVCVDSDSWPPYSQSIVDLHLPGGDDNTGVIFATEAA